MLFVGLCFVLSVYRLLLLQTHAAITARRLLFKTSHQWTVVVGVVAASNLGRLPDDHHF